MARQLSEIKREFKHSLSRPGILQVIGQHEIKTLHLVRNKHDNDNWTLALPLCTER